MDLFDVDIDKMSCNSTLDHLPDVYWRYLFGSSMALIGVITTLENLLVLLVLNRYADLYTPSNKILGSLAVADFLTGCIVAPLHVIQYFDSDIMHACVVEIMRRYFSTALIGASCMTLGFISYDRYLHLVKLQNYNMSKRTLYIGLIFCWTVPLLVPLFRKITDTEELYSAIIILIVSIILVTIIFSYFGVISALRRRKNDIVSRDPNISQSRTNYEYQAGVTVFIIITIYIIMVTPICLYFILKLTKLFDEKFLSKAYNFGIFLAVSNSAVNPLVYCYRTRSLKKYIVQIYLKCIRTLLGGSRDESNDLMKESSV